MLQTRHGALRGLTRVVPVVVAIAAGLAAGIQGAAQTDPFDLVLAGGRVMDPASGLDAVRHVGIRGSTVAAISPTPLTGRATIDVSGLVVAPGFIDPHSHAQTLEGNQFQA